MHFVSTRAEVCASLPQAIVQGISKEGGLYVPASFPYISPAQIRQMVDKPYTERAALVLSGYLDLFSLDEIREMANLAYAPGTYDAPEIVPLRHLEDGVSVMELWHGPTLAFKDMALRMLPHLLTKSAQMLGETREIVILVATSGDTGKAALSGFCDVPGTRCVVFYPKDGVARAQELQMVTQEGNNMGVIAVRGNFDDAQTGVKQIFASEKAQAELSAQGRVFSSANSINFGRLAPQIAYYFSAYADLLAQGRIEMGDPVNFAVPTGNFGDILAGVYAMEMGLPVGRLICASNENNVLSQFMRTGVYDARRKFYTTTSPSMDILISSNLERMLHLLSGGDGALVLGLMNQLKKEGWYKIEEAMHRRLQSLFWGGWASEERVRAQIAQVWNRRGYLMDPHTAVAMEVYEQYAKETGDGRPTVIVSTASPFKFGRAVAQALLPEGAPEDDFECCEAISRLTGWAVPPSISELTQKPVLHSRVCDVGEMQSALFSELNA